MRQRISLMVAVGRRFNIVAVPALIILIATGVYNAHHLLGRPELLLQTSYGTFLVIKIILVIALILTFLAHVRLIRKDVEEQIMNEQMPEQQVQSIRKKIIILGELMYVLSIVILFFAALLDAGV